MKGIVFRGARAARLESNLPVPAVKANHVLVKNSFCGINFLDAYYRDGLYQVAEGTVLGAEAGGVVHDCPEELKHDWLNKRVVFSHMGGFAEYSNVPVSKLIPVPDDVTIPTALALTIMGLTAHYLCTSTAKIQPGDNVLVHAAGSGTGRMVAQVASQVFGARVIGTCSTKKMQNVPLPLDQIVDYSVTDDLDARLKALTSDKQGFHAVFDGVGKTTHLTSLNVARPRGLVVYFGNASGPVPPIDPLALAARGSLSITRPRMQDFVATFEELHQRAQDVFEWTRSGKLSVVMDKEFKGLEAVDDALNYIKAGNATGKVVVRLDSKM